MKRGYMITNNDSRFAGRGLGVSFSLSPSARKNFGDKSFLIAAFTSLNDDVIAASTPINEGLREGELCPKCNGIIGSDGLCWKCLTENGK
jgi:hypothetical protein